MKIMRILFSVVVFTGLGYGQSYGRIAGRILESGTNQPLPGFKVDVREPVLTATTDDGGNFYFNFVTPGSYTLNFSLDGYYPIEITNVKVHPGRTTRVDVLEEAPNPIADKCIITEHQGDDFAAAVEPDRIPGLHGIEDLLDGDPDFSVNRYGIQSRGAPGVAYYLDGFRLLDPNLIDLGAVQVVNISASDVDPSYGDAVSGLVDVRTPITFHGGRIQVQTDDIPGREQWSRGERLVSAALGLGKTGSGLRGNFSGRLTATDSYQPALYSIPSPGLEDNARGRLRWLFPDHASNINITAVRGRTQYMVWNPYDDIGNNWKYAEHSPMRLFKNNGFGASADWKMRTNMLVSLRAGWFNYETYDGNRDYAWEDNNDWKWYDDFRLKAQHLIKYLRNEELPYRSVLTDSIRRYHRPPDNLSTESIRKNPYAATAMYFTLGDYPLWAYRYLENIQIGADHSWFPYRNWSIKFGAGYGRYASLFALNASPGYLNYNIFYEKTDPEAVISGYGRTNATFGALDVGAGVRLDHHRDFQVVWDSSSLPPFHKIYHSHLDFSPDIQLTYRFYGNMELFLYSGIRHHSRPYYPVDNQPSKIIDWDYGYRARLLNLISIEINPYFRSLSDFWVNPAALASYYENYHSHGGEYYPRYVKNAKTIGLTGRLMVYLGALDFRFVYNLQTIRTWELYYYYGPFDPYYPYQDSFLVNVQDPLGNDRSGYWSMKAAYKYPEHGPVISLRGVTWSLELSNQGGLRYTPTDLKGHPLLGDPNNAEMPGWTNIALSMGKKIKTGPVKLVLHARFDNVFNLRQVVNVYPTTGDPLDHGDPDPSVGQFGFIAFTSRYYTPQGDYNHDGLMTPVEGRDEYIRARDDFYDDPTHFNPGFSFRLGGGIEF